MSPFDGHVRFTYHLGTPPPFLFAAVVVTHNFKFALISGGNEKSQHVIQLSFVIE